MGLISRVSSRTYRKVSFTKKLTLKMAARQLIRSPALRMSLARNVAATPDRRDIDTAQVYWCWCRHRWCCRIWSRNRNCVRFSYHRLRPKPKLEATAFLLRHSWICSVRGYGSFLSHGCFLDPLCFVSARSKKASPVLDVILGCHSTLTKTLFIPQAIYLEK